MRVQKWPFVKNAWRTVMLMVEGFQSAEGKYRDEAEPMHKFHWSSGEYSRSGKKCAVWCVHHHCSGRLVGHVTMCKESYVSQVMMMLMSHTVTHHTWLYLRSCVRSPSSARPCYRVSNNDNQIQKQLTSHNAITIHMCHYQNTDRIRVYICCLFTLLRTEVLHYSKPDLQVIP